MIVNAACTVCGPQNIDAATIKLYMSRTQPERTVYTFTCPTCTDLVEREASPLAVHLLIDCAGVVPIWEQDPRSPRPGGAPLTEDDLIAFGRALEATSSPVG